MSLNLQYGIRNKLDENKYFLTALGSQMTIAINSIAMIKYRNGYLSVPFFIKVFSNKGT